jgi:pilus assembly protein CpaD
MKFLNTKLRFCTAAAIAALSLAACTGEELALDTKYTPNGGTEQYPITVGHGPQTLNIASKSGSLQPSQINAVAGFANKAAVSGATPIHIARPAGASSRLSHEIANLLVQQGVAQRAIHMTTYHGKASGPVKITYRAAHAHVRKCGDWSTDLTNTKFNEPMPNLGCAVQNNIAAMVTDPTDFAGPGPMDPAAATTRIPGLAALDSSATASGGGGATQTPGAGAGAGGGGGASGGGGSSP